jgi:hypothetical protein
MLDIKLSLLVQNSNQCYNKVKEKGLAQTSPM